MVSFCYSQNTSTNNLLSNGDFENGLDGYNTNSAANLVASVETTVVNPHTGSTSSVKLVSGALAGATTAGVFKTVAGNAVLGGGDEGNYLFSFWVKSETANQKIQARYVAAGDVYVKTNLMTFTDRQVEEFISMFSGPKSSRERITSDEYIHIMSLKKEEIINEVLHVMKESAVDCNLNKVFKQN